MENIEYHDEKRIALLIDADNIPTKYASIIFDELNKYGDIVIRRIYGDWTNQAITKWKEVSQQFAMKLIMQENNTPGKNASDICLVIDAMKLLYEKKAEIFCIVSSDSDFTLLAKEIRENGITVIGMGEEKTPKAFVNACKRFVILDKLYEDENVTEVNTIHNNDKDTSVHSQLDNNSQKEKVSSNVTSKEKIEKAIIEIIDDNNSKNKATGLGEIGSRLSKKYPEFDVRNYGYSNLSAFVRSLNWLSVSGNQRNLNVALISAKEDDIEETIINIVKKYGGTMNMGRLRQELDVEIPNVGSSIKAAGVTKFSTYLKSIKRIEVTDDNNTVKI